MTEWISKEIIDEARKTTPVVFGPIGEDVYRRTYSRTKRDGSQEDWYETTARVVNGNLNYVPEHFIEKDEAKKLYKLLLNMEVLPAGRHLWSTGIGKDFNNNCFSSDFSPVFSEHFQFVFMRLMEGGGVGSNYSTLFVNSRDESKPWQTKAKINIHVICHPSHADYNKPVQFDNSDTWFDALNTEAKLSDLLSTKYSYDWDAATSNGDGPIYIRVEDSREGWAEALVRLLNVQIDEDCNGRDVVFDISNIRPYGAILKGFGGKASGPDAFVLLVYRVNTLLNNKYNQNLTGMDFMLIDHYIAQAVVSGGVRRSARMAMKYWKDADIFEFIACKSPKDNIMHHWTTNISVVIDRKFINALKKGDPHATQVYDSVIEGMLTNGEPGFINATKCLEGESPGTEFITTNPCGEITMVRYPDMLAFDVCCLGHVNLDRAEDPGEAFRLVTRFLIRATFSKVADSRQKENVTRNRRIGVGFLGYHNWLVKSKIRYSDAPSNDKVRSFFRSMYQIIDTEAKRYCSQLRIPECIKKTTVAPTGTTGNLAGCTTGCQSTFSKMYIRRVRLANSDQLLPKLKKLGYNVVPDIYAANTSVVEYVCIDPIYEQAIDIFKAENLAEGNSETEARSMAQVLAADLIEDQDELSIEDVLATQRMLQKEFVDNSISITVNVNKSKYNKEELKTILRHFLPDLKGLTIFPEVSMPLSPLERITLDELLAREAEGYPIEKSQAEMNCGPMGCPIR